MGLEGKLPVANCSLLTYAAEVRVAASGTGIMREQHQVKLHEGNDSQEIGEPRNHPRIVPTY